MKKLFILILTVISIQSFGQSTSPTGYTRFYSKSSGDYWNINNGNIVIKDTTSAPIGVGEVRLQTSDQTVYIALSTTAPKKWYRIGGEASGAGLGSVTSVGLSIDGSVISESGTPVTTSGTLALAWQGAATDVVLGNGSYTNFSNAIRAVTDPLYSAAGHTHTHPQITNFQAGVLNSLTAGSGISISSAGVVSATGSFVQDGLISGGVVTWSGTGLVFDVTPAVYVIGGDEYTSDEDDVTLEPADATFGRWDVIAVDITGSVVAITGVPAASPVIPQIDPADQTYLTAVFIDAGATTPTLISNSLIYDENVEWTTSSSGGVTVNYNSTVYSQSGTKSALAIWSGSSNLIFTNGATLVSSNYTTLSYYIRLINTMPNNTNISVQFYNGTNPVSNQVTSTISKSTTGSFQLVSFNLSQFSFTSSQFTAVRFILTGSTSGVAVAIDNIKLQAGVTPPTTGTGLQSAYTRFTDGTTTATASGSDIFKIRSADNKLTVTAANNDATHGDNILLTVNQANLSIAPSQLTQGGASTNDVLKWNGSNWIPGTVTATTPGLDDVLAQNQALTNDRFVNLSNRVLEFDGSAAGYTIKGVNSSSGAGVYGSSSSGYGIYGVGGIGVFGYSTTGPGGDFAVQPASTNSIAEVLRIERFSGGTPANGIGASIDINVQTTATGRRAHQIISKLTDATDATYTSKMEIYGANNASLAKIIGIPSVIGNYADNAAALAAGLTAGDLYRNGDVLMIVH